MKPRSFLSPFTRVTKSFAVALLLGLIAYRTGETLQYDGTKGLITNHADANALMKRKYRDGWTFNDVAWLKYCSSV